LKVINMTDVPRGDWSYLVEKTGVTISSGTINALKRDVFSHMNANTIEIPRGFDEIVEDTACRNLGAGVDHWCVERKPEVTPPGSSKWRAVEVLRFLRTVTEWGVKEGFKFVPSEEAERRAAICATCPMNNVVPGCLGCSGVGSLVTSIRGSVRTKVDDKLHTCEVCGCYLQVKVLVPADVIDNKGLEYPSWCWQNPTDEPTDPGDDRYEYADAAKEHRPSDRLGA
jgi:hypothetical protein